MRLLFKQYQAGNYFLFGVLKMAGVSNKSNFSMPIQKAQTENIRSPWLVSPRANFLPFNSKPVRADMNRGRRSLSATAL